MMLTVRYQGDSRYEIEARSHTLVTDQPVEEGGGNAGMTPVEVFVGSLASCVAYFVGRYCDRHKIPCDGFTVQVEWAYAERPHRVGRVALRVNLPVALTPEQREKILRVAHGCTVHQSLVVPPVVDIDLSAFNP